MPVPFYDNQNEINTLMRNWSPELVKLIEQNQLVNGQQVEHFEREIENLTNIKHAVAVGNGTDGLIIGLTAAGIGPGDEVIVPCYSFFASVSSILHVGATPVFVDIEPETYAIDADLIEEAITDKTKAIMPVHLFCQMADMPRIQRIAEKYELIIFEDSAEAISMFQQQTHAGGFGIGGVLSFFPTKTLGALGDAGMLLSNDDDFATNCRMLRNLGRNESGIAQCIGFNSRMDEWQAMILRARLTQLEENIQRRAAHTDYLTSHLQKIPQVIRTPTFIGRDYVSNRVDYVYLIEVEDRDALSHYLAKGGIVTETYYPTPLHLQPICRRLGYMRGDFPVAEKSASQAIALPMFAEMKQEQLDKIIHSIREFFQG